MASAPANEAPDSALPLEVDALVKSFGAIKAVSGVSLELRGGECLGLLGPNGAGKSTVIRALVGRIIPDAGRISVFGAAAGSAEARAALGWIPQDLAVYPRLTCKENLLSFGRYHGLSGRKLTESVAWCLDWAALQDRAGELAKNLSGGMKRRLNMAAGIIHRPRVVLMDEPTVGVDPQSRIRIFEMIEALRAAGTAIVYTTHYMEEAERLCDRIAIIDHGRIIALGTNEELVYTAFASRSQVTARFAGSSPEIAAWVERRGGKMVDSAALFTIASSIEIAQIYASLPDAAGEPPKRLIGWARVELTPGESKQVSIPVSRDRLTVYDEASDGWKLVPGNYAVMAGGSSQDLPLHQQIDLP